MLRLLFLPIVALLTACQAPDTAQTDQPRLEQNDRTKHASLATHPKQFRLYYGNDAARLNELLTRTQDAVLVLDSRSLPATKLPLFLQQARSRNTITLGYISIGELDSADLKRAADACAVKIDNSEVNPLAINWNEKFNSWRVDVEQPQWRCWVMSEATRLQNEGFTGLFLDTPDTVDNYVTHPIWSRTLKGEKVRAMIALIREIKAQFPDRFVLLNRGLNLMGEKIWMNESGSDTENGLALAHYHPNNPDAVLYENAFASNDAWSQRMEGDLTRIAGAGFTQVFALGYADTTQADDFFVRAKTAGFVAAWAASSTTLHEQATLTEAEWQQTH